MASIVPYVAWRDKSSIGLRKLDLNNDHNTFDVIGQAGANLAEMYLGTGDRPGASTAKLQTGVMTPGLIRCDTRHASLDHPRQAPTNASNV